MAKKNDDSGSCRSSELTERLDETQEELFNLRFQTATGSSTTTEGFGELRRDIARIKTVLRERELASARRGDHRVSTTEENVEDERVCARRGSGRVVSDVMDKTVVVEVRRRRPAPDLRKDRPPHEAPQGA